MLLSGMQNAHFYQLFMSERQVSLIPAAYPTHTGRIPDASPYLWIIFWDQFTPPARLYIPATILSMRRKLSGIWKIGLLRMIIVNCSSDIEKY